MGDRARQRRGAQHPRGRPRLPPLEPAVVEPQHHTDVGVLPHVPRVVECQRHEQQEHLPHPGQTRGEPKPLTRLRDGSGHARDGRSRNARMRCAARRMRAPSTSPAPSTAAAAQTRTAESDGSAADPEEARGGRYREDLHRGDRPEVAVAARGQERLQQRASDARGGELHVAVIPVRKRLVNPTTPRHISHPLLVGGGKGEAGGVTTCRTPPTRRAILRRVAQPSQPSLSLAPGACRESQPTQWL
eukprot:COSAG04_NODE_6177_length_1392_cov_1.072699_1_plen_245_part_00